MAPIIWQQLDNCYLLLVSIVYNDIDIEIADALFCYMLIFFSIGIYLLVVVSIQQETNNVSKNPNFLTQVLFFGLFDLDK